jgi:hypothetical protein
MNDCERDVILARAQIGLAFFFGFAFMGCLGVLMFDHAVMSAQELTIVTGLTSVLGTIVTQQSNYFFARQRPHTPTDGATDQIPPLVPPKETTK